MRAAAVTLIGAWMTLTAEGGTGRAGSSTGSGAPGRTVAHASAGTSAAHGAGTSRAGRLELRSNAALVIDEGEGRTLFEKNPERIAPIASITKLMTAMVTLDATLPSDEIITIERSDVDGRKHTASRLKVGDRLSRGDLLWVALMASENRAAAALARNYPGGAGECVSAMNRKAQELGMLHTRFEDPTGLSSQNVSTAQELTLLVRSAYQYPAIRESTTSASHTVAIGRGRMLEYHNSNGLVKNRTWDIELSKTGYINEAGRCLVMRAEIAARPVIIVLLDSWGKYTRLGDANRIRKWMESTLPRVPGAA